MSSIKTCIKSTYFSMYLLGLTSPRLHYGHSFASMSDDIETSHFGTGAEMGWGPIWGFMYDDQFWHWAPSARTGCIAKSLRAQFQNWVPQIGTVPIRRRDGPSAGTWTVISPSSSTGTHMSPNWHHSVTVVHMYV